MIWLVDVRRRGRDRGGRRQGGHKGHREQRRWDTKIRHKNLDMNFQQWGLDCVTKLLKAPLYVINIWIASWNCWRIIWTVSISFQEIKVLLLNLQSTFLLNVRMGCWSFKRCLFLKRIRKKFGSFICIPDLSLSIKLTSSIWRSIPSAFICTWRDWSKTPQRDCFDGNISGPRTKPWGTPGDPGWMHVDV